MSYHHAYKLYKNSRLIVFDQEIEEEKLKERSREAKRAKARDGHF